jgi:NADH:ubiquinone oxidoreductase subunit 6 (subunit J)
MSLYNIIFYFFLVLAGLSALGILFVTNVFKGALLLLTSLLSLAAVYVFAFAEFVAVTQVMIYAGGIVVVIIFGIMLTTKISGAALKVENANLFSGILVSGALLVLLVRFLSQPLKTNGGEIKATNNISATGINLMTDYVLPFELAGLLLLMALVGAAIIAASMDKPKKV